MTAGDVLLALVAFAASMLTFFSGFGLGTLLLAFMLLYFPPEIAIGITAIVHLVNNIFKYLLTRNHIDTRLMLTFGLPAIVGALLGAYMLQYLNEIKPIYQYEWAGKLHFITVIKIVVGFVMTLFVVWEWVPGLQNSNLRAICFVLAAFSRVFGGLSGHQGALRSAFLSKGDLDKETFIATGVAIACLIDLSRLQYYARHFHTLTLKTINYLFFYAFCCHYGINSG